MKIINKFFLLVIVSTVIFSCDRDNDIPAPDPPRPLTEIQLEDDQKIQEFLATNFYNYEEFENPPQGFDFKIKIDSVKGDNATKRPLSEFVRDTIIELTTAGNLGESQVKVAHKLYYLIARQGAGEFVTPYDSIFHKFEGSLLNGNIFDSTNDTYSWFDVGGFLRGFSAGIAKLRTGSEIIVNNDGTTSISNTGIGMVILPSALAYYNTEISSIPIYSPLIFKLDVALIQNDTDADNDGIPNRLEDLNNNGYLQDDNTNAEEERKAFTGQTQTVFANFRDADDDGDGTPTSEEIIINDDGTITFPDTDGDGIADYLDRDTK